MLPIIIEWIPHTIMDIEKIKIGWDCVSFYFLESALAACLAGTITLVETRFALGR
jgi:hypothetical protein